MPSMKKTARYIVGVHRSVSTYQLPTPWSRSFAIAWLGDHQPPKPKGGRVEVETGQLTPRTCPSKAYLQLLLTTTSFVPQSSAWMFEKSKSSKVQSNFDAEPLEIILFRNPLWTLKVLDWPTIHTRTQPKATVVFLHVNDLTLAKHWILR